MRWSKFWKALLAGTGPIAVGLGALTLDGDLTARDWASVGLAALGVLAVLFGPSNKEAPAE